MKGLLLLTIVLTLTKVIRGDSEQTTATTAATAGIATETSTIQLSTTNSISTTETQDDYKQLLNLKDSIENYNLTWPDYTNYKNGRLYSTYHWTASHTVATKYCDRARQRLYTIKAQDNLQWIHSMLKAIQKQREEKPDYSGEPNELKAWVENLGGIPDKTDSNEIITGKSETRSECTYLEKIEEKKFKITVADCQSEKLVICVADTTKLASYEDDVALVISQAKEEIKETIKAYDKIILRTDQSKGKYKIRGIIENLQKQLKNNIDELLFSLTITNLRQQVDKIVLDGKENTN